LFEKIFEILGQGNQWCVEFGARDGKLGSNTWNLIVNKGWSAVPIEANEKASEALKQTYQGLDRVHPIQAFVAQTGEKSLDALLGSTPIPQDFDLLVIDIDGNDWHIWNSLKKHQPKIVCIEFNPTVPNDVVFIQDSDPDINQGCSLLALVELGKSKGYELIATTSWDAIFVVKELFPKFNIKDNNIDSMWTAAHRELKIFQCYDGTLYTAGVRMLQWFKIPFEPDEIQLIPRSMRHYHNESASVRRSQRIAARYFSTEPEPFDDE
jgi:hypothetical protein